MVDKVLTVCNLVVTTMKELRAALQTGQRLQSMAPSIADHLLFVHKDQDMNEVLTLPRIEELLQSYVALHSPNHMAAVDCNNELQLYHELEMTPTSKSKLKSNPTAGADAKGAEEGEHLAETLRKTIGLYEKLLLELKVQGKDTFATEKLLASLRQQLAAFLKTTDKNAAGSERSSDIRLSRQVTRGKSRAVLRDRVHKALDEVFHFYTKQCALAHVRKTFEAVQNEMNTMGMGYFLKFAKDFAFPMEHHVTCLKQLVNRS